jgi:hypothetical protein
VVYTLTPSDVSLLAVQPSVAILFEMYNGDSMPSPYNDSTSAYVDYVRVYATGGSGGAALDPNEPNDTASNPTPLVCSTPITGTIGDALGGSDVDWFQITGAPSGVLNIDLDAQTKVPPSTLDSVVRLWDVTGTQLLAFNDDDGVTYDSFISYTVPAGNPTYLVSVESYTGYGGPTAYYDLKAVCSSTGGDPGGGAGERPAR